MSMLKMNQRSLMFLEILAIEYAKDKGYELYNFNQN